MKAVYLVLFNQFITVPFSMLFFWLSKYRGCPFTRELPTFHWVLYEIGMFALIEEFFFYYSHRYISIFFFYSHGRTDGDNWLLLGCILYLKYDQKNLAVVLFRLFYFL